MLDYLYRITVGTRHAVQGGRWKRQHDGWRINLDPGESIRTEFEIFDTRRQPAQNAHGIIEVSLDRVWDGARLLVAQIKPIGFSPLLVVRARAGWWEVCEIGNPEWLAEIVPDKPLRLSWEMTDTQLILGPLSMTYDRREPDRHIKLKAGAYLTGTRHQSGRGLHSGCEITHHRLEVEHD